MWLINSSVGRKVVMSITGASLVLFLLFHASMNLVAIISEEGYNMICEFLGANWYALVATAGLAGLVVLHILYAFILTVQNYRARGSQRYAVSANQKDVSWASKNMLVLGVIVVLGIGLHLFNFWYKMQFAEILHMAGVADADIANATNGVYWIKETFANPIYVGLYLVWLAAIWFHLTHGVWSAMHSLGLNNGIWMKRVKCISNIVSTLVVLMFAVVVVYYFAMSLCA
ncbi:MAG: succinate dehydrogenase/fumarate reductase cytochrome b subunit [Paludibacteraceae bacterium]|nr:succinate dehydrogenase/fumarate reductase cytochrome b subunit [Paludibacteraceae bacterium]